MKFNLTEGEVKGEIGELGVDIKIDKKKKTLHITDNGVGMSSDEVKKYINDAEKVIDKLTSGKGGYVSDWIKTKANLKKEGLLEKLMSVVEKMIKLETEIVKVNNFDKFTNNKGSLNWYENINCDRFGLIIIDDLLGYSTHVK